MGKLNLREGRRLQLRGREGAGIGLQPSVFQLLDSYLLYFMKNISFGASGGGGDSRGGGDCAWTERCRGRQMG